MKSRYIGRAWSIAATGAALALAAVIGVGFATYVMGWRVIDPRNISWLSNDPATAYLGWLFFRHEPHLAFPLGWSSAIGYPLGEPIAYLDSIPLLAAILWPFRHALPGDFQYLGPYFAFCATMQLYFGYRLCRRLAGGDGLVGALGGLFFLIAPPFVWRGFGHFALSSQWLVVAALDWYVAAPKRRTRPRVVSGATLAFIAGGVNPYIAFMTLLVEIAGYGRLLIVRNDASNQRSAHIVGAVLSCVAAGAALLIFGFIRLGHGEGYAGDGYETYSMNLLAPIDPEVYSALLLKAQATFTGQHEGYNYLGLGIIGLGLLAVARRPATLSMLVSLDALPAWGVFIVSLFLALSLKATAGSWVIYDISAPEPVLKVLSALRASGRLFWSAYYLVIAGIAFAAVQAFGRRSAPVIAIALVVQFIDVRSLFLAVSDHWLVATGSSFTDGEPWTSLRKSNRHLVILPPWQCSGSSGSFGPGGVDGFWSFGKLAAQERMTINSFYAGRTSSTQVDYYCSQQPEMIRRDGFADGTAYVLESPAQLLGIDLGDHYCRPVDGVILCAKEPGRTGIDESLLMAIPLVKPGERISFGSQAKPEDAILASGWSFREPWGRWTDGTKAVLAFRIGGAPKSTTVQMSLDALVTHPQHVEVLANKRRVASWYFESREATQAFAIIPPNALRGDGIIVLELRLPDAASPKALGLSGDSRMLGIGLIGLSITMTE
jgi:hypothetical protein